MVTQSLTENLHQAGPPRGTAWSSAFPDSGGSGLQLREPYWEESAQSSAGTDPFRDDRAVVRREWTNLTERTYTVQ